MRDLILIKLKEFKVTYRPYYRYSSGKNSDIEEEIPDDVKENCELNYLEMK